MTPLVYIMPRGTTQIDDISTWLPPSLHTPWWYVFFEYINNLNYAEVTGQTFLTKQNKMAVPINKSIIAILKPLQYTSTNKSYIQNVFIRENRTGKPFLKLSMVKYNKANIYV